MIDLSHLTEEEQGVIMAVLRRDAELKRAEEERIRRLEKVAKSGSQSKSGLKYLSGQWFYEAKSRRHKDKIHGSEIILASMKQRAAGPDEMERKTTSGSTGSDLVAPPKPTRYLETTQPKEMNDADKESQNSTVRSPRTPRHNPFNSDTLSVVEQTDNSKVFSPTQDQTPSETGTEGLTCLTVDTSQTSGGSVTFKSSSLGFRPVPKKRSFLSKRTCSQSESSDPGMEPQLGSDGIAPAPRWSLQRGSSRCSNQSNPRDQSEMLPKSVAVVSNQVSRSAHLSSPTDEVPQQPPCDVTHVLANSILEVDRNLSVLTSSRPATRSRSEATTDGQSSKKSNDPRTAGQHAPGNTVTSLTGSIQDFHTSSSVTEVMKQEDLSLTQSNIDADPPLSYELYFIDTADGQIQNKSGQMHSFKLSTQASSPTGDEEDSIAKVLDWFNRSTDSSDWLKAKDGHGEIHTVGGGDSFRKDDRRNETPEMKIRETNVFRTTDKGLSNMQDGVEQDARERLHSHAVNDKDKKQNTSLFQMKSFWEKSNTYPKISVRQNQGRKAANLSAQTEGETLDYPSKVCDLTKSDVNTRKEIYDSYISNAGDESDEMMLIISQEKDSECVNVTNKLESNSFHTQIPANLKARNQIYGADTQILLPAKENPAKELPKSTPLSQLDAGLQTKNSPDSEETHLSRNSPCADRKLHGNDIRITHKVQKQSGSSEDLRTRHGEDKSMQLSMSQKRKDDKSSDGRAKSPRSQRQGPAREENTAERTKQLRSFWEQERNKPLFHTSRPKAVLGTHLSKLNKRFTKSEYDLRAIGGSPACGEEDTNRNHQNIPLSQRIDKLSPSLSASRSQFNTLRDFWDEATSECKGSYSSEKLKSPKKKEQMSPQHPREEAKGADPELQSPQLASGCMVVNDSNNSKSLCVGQQRESKMSLKDQGKSMKPQSGKESRSLKRRKDFFNSSGGGNSFRRATSMFCLNVPAEKEHGLFRINISPIHSQSRKQNVERAETGQRTSEDVEKMSPRARAYVPRDYRHYLGVTDKTIVHPSLVLAQTKEASESQAGHERELGGPLRASTPVGSEEGDGNKVSRLSRPPLWTNYSTSDTSQKSSVSSTSETWSNIWPSSQRGDDDENQNPVRKALRRAEARPKNLAKSMVDIAAASSTRQDPPADMRSTDVLSIPSSFTPTFSDADHLKTMSKSVPSFLQKENDSKDSDCTYEESYLQGSLMTNLSSSSGMASLSGSVMTMCDGGDFGNVEVQGNIHFSINYVQKLREFHIFVAECQDLAAVDPKRGRSDPYVKSYLSPDKANLGKRKTTVKKKTLNPTFNEILRYRVRLEYLRTQTLILSVWHNDTFGRNSFLGEVDVDLSKWDFNHTQMNYLALGAKTTPNPDPSNGRGEMRLAIRYLPDVIHCRGIAKEGLTMGEIHIWVKECKNLPLIRTTIDPFVKCYVLPDTSRKSRQKTRVLRRTVDPVFNHTMVYDGIRESDLTEACVELTVWDRDRLASNLLGGLRLGAGTGKSYGAAVNWMDSTPHEVALWERMVASPNEWVEDVLPVRSLNSGKTAFK